MRGDGAGGPSADRATERTSAAAAGGPVGRRAAQGIAVTGGSFPRGPLASRPRCLGRSDRPSPALRGEGAPSRAGCGRRASPNGRFSGAGCASSSAAGSSRCTTSAALSIESHRLGEERPSSTRGKLAALDAIDGEIATLAARAGPARGADRPARARDRRLPPLLDDPRQRRQLLPGLRARDGAAGAVTAASGRCPACGERARRAPALVPALRRRRASTQLAPAPRCAAATASPRRRWLAARARRRGFAIAALAS